MAETKPLTLEEKLIRHLQGSGFAALAEDHDAVVELARKAINQALITPRNTPGSSWNDRQIPAPAVKAAEQAAEAACKELVLVETTRLQNDPIFIHAIREAIAARLPVVFDELLRGSVVSMMRDTAESAILTAQARIRGQS